MEIITTLKDFGLSDEEAKIYLAGVKLGDSSLSKLAQEAEIKRTTAYLVVERLEEKGLMGRYKVKTGLKFVTVSPQKLEKLAQKKFESIREIVPELNLYSTDIKNKPKVTLFEGKEGYLNIFDDPLQYTGITIRAMGSLQNTRKIITTKYDEEYFVPKRLKKGINFKGLYFKDEVTEMGLTTDKNKEEKRQIKILPKEFFQPIFTMIYNDTVVKFTSQEELIALKIVSPEIAQSEKANFDMVWGLLGE